jgi:hypothetical protein
MTGWTVAIIVLGAVLVAVVLLWAWRSSAKKVPSDESLRHPRPQAADPLVRAESKHRDTPGPADLDQHGGREHNT